MRIVPYSGEHYHRLAAAVQTAGAAQSLLHRPFVDWYYGTRDWCRLWLGYDKEGTLAAAVGIEQLPFEIDGAPVSVAASSIILRTSRKPSLPASPRKRPIRPT